MLSQDADHATGSNSLIFKVWQCVERKSDFNHVFVVTIMKSAQLIRMYFIRKMLRPLRLSSWRVGVFNLLRAAYPRMIIVIGAAVRLLSVADLFVHPGARVALVLRGLAL